MLIAWFARSPVRPCDGSALVAVFRSRCRRLAHRLPGHSNFHCEHSFQASRGELRSLRGLSELPHFREVGAAIGRPRRISRESASRRWRTDIVSHPIHDFSSSSILADVFGGNDGYAGPLFGGDAGAVDAGPESRRVNPVHPGMYISFLFRQHPAAFFLIEENYRSGRKALTLGGGNSGLTIGFAKLACLRDGLQLSQEFPAEENQKSEPRGLRYSPFADPGVHLLARRMVEPETRVGKCLPEKLQFLVPWIVIAVEAQVDRSGFDVA